ncbi:hypothetical protein BaRGS_00027604 [Batillaria attramentaria]|uniref:Uncharacterized protein n=1 Tax=Batillaria attramentaria TaxID=370345 RepID=A0ABD0K2Q7_9CAEN
MSTLLRDTLTEVKKGNLSVQEACYYLLGMPVSNANRTTLFVNTVEPEKRVSTLKSEDVLKTMDPDSTDILCRGLLDHYTNRPDCLEDLCLAEFATMYNYKGQEQRVNMTMIREKIETPTPTKSLSYRVTGSL